MVTDPKCFVNHSSNFSSYLSPSPRKESTVDGRNPAAVDVVDIPVFIGFYTSQVQDHLGRSELLGFFLEGYQAIPQWFPKILIFWSEPNKLRLFWRWNLQIAPGIWHLNRIQGLNNSWVCCILFVSHKDDPLEMLGEYALNEYQGIFGLLKHSQFYIDLPV